PRAPIQHPRGSRRARLERSRARPSRLSEPREEGAREGGAPAGLLVLEVDVDALPGRDLAHACRPAVQVGVAVVRAPETQVAEGGGGYGRGGEVVGLGDAERGAMLAEEIVGLVVEPALVPELEGGFEAARQARQEVAAARGAGRSRGGARRPACARRARRGEPGCSARRRARGRRVRRARSTAAPGPPGRGPRAPRPGCTRRARSAARGGALRGSATRRPRASPRRA